MQQDTFIVRFSARYFFLGRKDGAPTATMIPSIARFLSYDCAILVVRALRSLGYGDAVVCTTRGQIAMPEDLCVQDQPCQDEFEAAWGCDSDEEEPEAELEENSESGQQE